jgi:hypothetical protein
LLALGHGCPPVRICVRTCCGDYPGLRSGPLFRHRSAAGAALYREPISLTLRRPSDRAPFGKQPRRFPRTAASGDESWPARCRGRAGIVNASTGALALPTSHALDWRSRAGRPSRGSRCEQSKNHRHHRTVRPYRHGLSRWSCRSRASLIAGPQSAPDSCTVHHPAALHRIPGADAPTARLVPRTLPAGTSAAEDSD